MAALDGQAFVDQTTLALQQVRAELQVLRAEQDAATATVTTITADVATFKGEQREQARLLVEQYKADLAGIQGHLAGLNLPDLMVTQGLIMDEKIKTALTVSSISTGGTKEGKFWKSILESKAITDLSPLDDSKTYRDWNRKFKNAFEQTRPHSRKVLAFVESLTESEVETNFVPSRHKNKFDSIVELYAAKYEPEHPGLEELLEEANRDLWAVLIAKASAKSNADDKIKGVAQGEGFWAYLRVHKWFQQTTEQGMINRRTNIMNPDPVKHDWELAGAIERWEERYRTLHEEEKDECLPEKYRMAALRKMLTGDIKKHVDLHISKITGYDSLRSTIMNWAIDRKLERDRKDDPMDTSHVGDSSNDDDWNGWDGYWGEQETATSGEPTPEVNSVGKGQKGAKGSKGGGKGQPGQFGGKGPTAILAKLLQLLTPQGGGKGGSGGAKGGDKCNKCGGSGHAARNCTSKVELRTCGNCGIKGHLQADCRKQKRISFVDDEPAGEPDETRSVEVALSKAMAWGGVMDCSTVEFPALPAKQTKRTSPKACEILAVSDEPETQGDWEVMSTANRGGPSWRRKTEKGYIITFVVDSGTAKTMAPRNMVPGMKPYKTANTGKNFRVAEGTLIPNEGELRLNGESNRAPLDFKAQVAKVTKPLASTMEVEEEEFNCVPCTPFRRLQ